MKMVAPLHLAGKHSKNKNASLTFSPLCGGRRIVLKLGGIRVNPELGARQRLTQYTRLTIKWIQQNKTVNIDTPTDARLGIPR